MHAAGEMHLHMSPTSHCKRRSQTAIGENIQPGKRLRPATSSSLCLDPPRPQPHTCCLHHRHTGPRRASHKRPPGDQLLPAESGSARLHLRRGREQRAACGLCAWRPNVAHCGCTAYWNTCVARAPAKASGLATCLHGESSALHSSRHRTQSAPPGTLLAVGRTMRGAIHDESSQQSRSMARHGRNLAIATLGWQLTALPGRIGQATPPFSLLRSRGHRAQFAVPRPSASSTLCSVV